MWLDSPSDRPVLLHALGWQQQWGEVRVCNAHPARGWHPSWRRTKERKVQGGDQEAEGPLQLWQVGSTWCEFSHQVLWRNNYPRKRWAGVVVWGVHEEGVPPDNSEDKEEWRQDPGRRDEQSKRLGRSLTVAFDTRHACLGSIGLHSGWRASRRRRSDTSWSEQNLAFCKEQCACEAEISGERWGWRRHQGTDRNHVCRCGLWCEEGS